MSITYSSYVSQISNIMVIASSDPNFQTFLPGAIDYAEGRCYRELDLVATTVTGDLSVLCSSGIRTCAVSTAQGTIQVLERINILTPASAPSSNATRNPVYFVAPEYLDAVYPSGLSSNCGLPLFAARVSDTTVYLGPIPDQPYTTEQFGTFRPTPLSSGNSSTWLTQWVPELFIAATMVFAAGYMRDFGAQSDNPQMAQSWEQQYQNLFKSANTDELRKKFQSVGWSHNQPSPIATPPRA